MSNQDDFRQVGVSRVHTVNVCKDDFQINFFLCKRRPSAFDSRHVIVFDLNTARVYNVGTRIHRRVIHEGIVVLEAFIVCTKFSIFEFAGREGILFHNMWKTREHVNNYATTIRDSVASADHIRS